MALTTLKPRLSSINPNSLKVLDTKAGATERIRGRTWMDIRRDVLLRDGYSCKGCGRVHASNEVDHIVPLEQGGSNEASNLQTLCGGPLGCHTLKTKHEAKARAGR